MATRSKASRRARTQPGSIPNRKPMVLARRVSLFQREIRVRLSSAAIEILLEAASVLSEGGADDDRFFGSTMITIDLTRAADLVSDPCDEASARRLAELIGSDQRLLDRAREVAYGEALRLAGVPIADAQIDLHPRHAGVNLHLDMDIEAKLAEVA